jgi:ribosomal protein L30E
MYSPGPAALIVFRNVEDESHANLSVISDKSKQVSIYRHNGKNLSIHSGIGPLNGRKHAVQNPAELIECRCTYTHRNYDVMSLCIQNQSSSIIDHRASGVLEFIEHLLL